ncbi:pentapeptide repeat-containing protein [Aliinostoc sp. HNIBRCY26]|uniref:pentapeptide repeat-containing protein n=1 Tax=Aliinostoc sp. HNIBRCY26 TaxID=3418997 RepID=UPI003D0681FF
MSANKTAKPWQWLIGTVIIFVSCVVLISWLFATPDNLSIQEQLQYRNQALTTTAIAFLGLGLTIHAYYTVKRIDAIQKSAIAAEKNLEISLQNVKLSQDRLISERLMSAIAQIGHEKIATRTSAIYVLEKIAQDFPQEHWTIMEILTAFVRENADLEAENHKEENTATSLIQPKNPEEDQLEEFPKLRRDIQAALTVIGRRNSQQDDANKKLDLRFTDLKRADLLGTDLQRVDLRGADLRGADLHSCNLSDANLENAKLSGCFLYEANLVRANLQSANLQGANLNRADLYSANLREANLTGASLRAANLQGANLYKANLQQTTLKVANLTSAKLFLANLQGAKLGKANLSLCGLIGANLQGANLNSANLCGANLNAAKLTQTEIIFADFTEASLTEADLSKANLMGANLQKANLYEANLSQASLVGANLAETDFFDVNLAGAILTGVKNLVSQQLSLAIGDRTTKLPDHIEIPIHWRQSS